jgi:hypothetical protein
MYSNAIFPDFCAAFPTARRTSLLRSREHPRALRRPEGVRAIGTRSTPYKVDNHALRTAASNPSDSAATPMRKVSMILFRANSTIGVRQTLLICGNHTHLLFRTPGSPGFTHSMEKQMTTLKFMSAGFLFAAILATPAIAREKRSDARHVAIGAYAAAAGAPAIRKHRCAVRAPDVGAFATAPWRKPPCEITSTY